MSKISILIVQLVSKDCHSNKPTAGASRGSRGAMIAASVVNVRGDEG
jgi:hypothetical protein